MDVIEDRCNLLRHQRHLGPSRSDLAVDARILTIERWIVLYRLIDDGVQIVRIVDGARDLTKLEWTPE